MKSMFRSAVMLFVCIMFIGCGGSSGGSDPVPPTPDVYITGSIHNIPDVLAKVSVYESPSYKVITSITTLPDVIRGELIEVTVQIDNQGDTDLTDLDIEIQIEDDIFLTKETWRCYQCFPHETGDVCNSIEEIIGGDINNTQPTPILEACIIQEPSVSGYCVDTFFDGLDCDSPTWKEEYGLPGDGYWKWSSENVTVTTNESYTATVGFGHSDIAVKNDRFGSWSVKDNKGVVLDSRDYTFNVVEAAPL